MKKQLRVGITAKNFYLWDGGIDFIATIAQGFEFDENTTTFLLLKQDSIILKVAKVIKIIIKDKLSIQQIRDDVNRYNSRYEKLIEVFKECSPKTNILWYKGSYFDDDRNIMRCLQKHNIHILLPHNGYFKNITPVPWVGYMYDFQHEYLSNLFSQQDIETRRKELKERLDNSEYVIVNAKDVERDIKKFYPDNNSKIFSLPFAPFQKPKRNSNVDLSNYDLPQKYYIISNQFWRHKNHLLAFEALNLIYKMGYHDIHIVCTGKLEDSRDHSYISDLMRKVKSMECSCNIHFLGYIPKIDQIEIMRNAVGIIQPTLCEGGARRWICI